MTYLYADECLPYGWQLSTQLPVGVRDCKGDEWELCGAGRTLPRYTYTHGPNLYRHIRSGLTRPAVWLQARRGPIFERVQPPPPEPAEADADTRKGPWSEAENAVGRDESLTDAEVAARLNRSLNAVRSRRRKLRHQAELVAKAAPRDWQDTETRITDPVTGGEKGQKDAQLGALDPVALYRLAQVAGQGASKYSRYNFLKGYDWSLSYDAMMRHALKFWAGEDYDQESGQHHMAHAAWHALALLSFHEHKLGTDDRFTG